MYLFVFDLYVAFLDIAILLLVFDEHDLYDPVCQKYVHTVEEIGRVDIETKFKFLREHNLGELLIRQKDQELRNKIAHNNFDLADDENVIIQHKDKKYFVREQLAELLDFCIDLTRQLDSKR